MRVNRSNRFPLLLASGPRGVPPPQRVTPTLLSGNGGARKFQHATRIKKKRGGGGGKSDKGGRKERRGNGSEEIKRIKDAQFNRAVAIFCQSYDLFHVFPPLASDKPFCRALLARSLASSREGISSFRTFGGKYAPRGRVMSR